MVQPSLRKSIVKHREPTLVVPRKRQACIAIIPKRALSRITAEERGTTCSKRHTHVSFEINGSSGNVRRRPYTRRGVGDWVLSKRCNRIQSVGDARTTGRANEVTPRGASLSRYLHRRWLAVCARLTAANARRFIISH